MNDTTTSTPDILRAEMVDRITAAGWASERVDEAMRTVPRHEFVPEADLAQAYGDLAVITKTGPDGAALSCASEPVVVAMMLDQLDLRPGQRVLEIGAGTGYNAALLAHLTGSTGQVTTVDIDPEVTARARRALDATGYGQVHVATRDGALGDAGHAPYDRMIVTVGAWDIPPAWWAQLAPTGRLVVPLRWRGQTRSVAFTRDGDRLVSDSVRLCGFVPMIGQAGERHARLDADGQVTLYWDTDQRINPAALVSVLDQPSTSVWSNVAVGGEESFDGVWLRLTGTQPGTCRIAATPAAVESGLCTPAISVRSPAIVEADSLAYLSLRRITDGDTSQWELGATGHGAAGAGLADRICQDIIAWSRDRAAVPIIRAHTTGSPDAPQAADCVIVKQHVRLAITIR